MYNPTYHEASEEIDDELFQQFCEDTKYFKDISRNRKYSDIDYTCTDIKGRKCSVELKRRDCSIEQYDTIYIECSKFWKLIERFNQFRYIPLYLNFMTNGALMFNLIQWNSDPTKIKLKKTKINNKGYEEQQYTYRYELPIEEAIMFKRDGGIWIISRNDV